MPKTLLLVRRSRPRYPEFVLHAGCLIGRTVLSPRKGSVDASQRKLIAEFNDYVNYPT
jgi:hypothetical protein